MDERHNHHEIKKESVLVTYRPLILILGFIIVVDGVILNTVGDLSVRDAMRIFMGLFFLLFGFFKTLDWKGFVGAYTEYDILAKRSRTYATLYPAIELALGILYLLNAFPTATNIVTVIVMGIGSIGVIQTLLDKKKIRCACLGTVVKLPMTTVTVIEDIGMGIMALAILLL